MKIAVISDIHSNCFAFEAVLNEAERHNVEGYIILGDIFGYYPWAVETYNLLSTIKIVGIIKGNHDTLLNKNEPSANEVAYWDMCKHNENSLKTECPSILNWLEGLSLSEILEIDGYSCSLFHGTPVNPYSGRYYPDDLEIHDWLPSANHITMLGHTHYPIIRNYPAGGLVLNPGSVGQPRDGTTDPSWIFIDTEEFLIELKRTRYDILKTVGILRDMEWNERAILALQKDYTGRLECR